MKRRATSIKNLAPYFKGVTIRNATPLASIRTPSFPQPQTLVAGSRCIAQRKFGRLCWPSASARSRRGLSNTAGSCRLLKRTSRSITAISFCSARSSGRDKGNVPEERGADEAASNKGAGSLRLQGAFAFALPISKTRASYERRWRSRSAVPTFRMQCDLSNRQPFGNGPGSIPTRRKPSPCGSGWLKRMIFRTSSPSAGGFRTLTKSTSGVSAPSPSSKCAGTITGSWPRFTTTGRFASHFDS